MHKSIFLSILISALMMTVCNARTTPKIDTTISYRASFFEKMPSNKYSFFFNRFKYKEIKSAPILRGDTPAAVTIVMGSDSTKYNRLWAIINHEDSSFTFTSIDDVKMNGENQLSGSITFQLFKYSYDEYTIEFIVLLKSDVILFRWVGSSTSSLVAHQIPIAKPTPISVGKLMPEVSVNTLANYPINLNCKNDSIVVINWWSTKCPPCVEEIPNLNKLVETNKGKKIKFIGIAWNHAKELHDFLTQHPFSYEHHLFNDSTIAVLGNSYPRNIIINSDGIVVYDHIGVDEKTYSNIDIELKKLLVSKEIADTKYNAQQYGKDLGQLYGDKKYDDLLKKADDILKIDPNNPIVNLFKGRVLVDKAEYRAGKPFVQAAIDNDTANSYIKAWGLFYLAQIEHMVGDRKKAKDCLSNCIEMKATRNVTNAAERYGILTGSSIYYKDWSAVETEHILFLFQPNTKVTDKNRFCELRENAFKTIDEYFKTKLPRKIVFIVWNGNEDATNAGIKMLGFSKPELCSIHSTYEQTIGHELTHVISHYLIVNPIKTRFVNEGMAVAFDLDGERSKINSAKVKKAKDGNSEKISILEAWENPNKYPEWVYYSFAGEFVKRLIAKGGDDKFLKLTANQTYDNAKSIYGDQLQEIISELENEIN